MAHPAHHPRHRWRHAFAGEAILIGAVLLGAASPAHAATTSCTAGSGLDFHDRTPTTGELSARSLRCANFDGAHLDDLNFEQADLTGATFTGATMTHSDLSQATLTGANLTGATLTDTSFEQATMTGVTLTRIHATGADFEQVDLTGVPLQSADLEHADFSQATLTRANLEGANLTGATLDQATLTKANLTDATLTGASLNETNTSDTTTTGLRGLIPLDLLSALLVLILAVATLRPRLRTNTPGRTSAVIVLLGAIGLTAAEAATAVGFTPTSDTLFFLPVLLPFLFYGAFLRRHLLRRAPGILTNLVAIVGIAGFFFLASAGLSFISDTLFGLFPLTHTCTATSCAGGLARGATGITIGLTLTLLAAALSHLGKKATPTADVAAWEQLQKTGTLNPSTPATPPPNNAPIPTPPPRPTPPGQNI